jgi:YggT family protein
MRWLVSFIDLLFWALNLAILIRVIVSWLNVSPYNPIIAFIWQITDPILEPLRRIVPPIGMIDITPILAMVVLSLIQQVLLMVLGQLIR